MNERQMTALVERVGQVLEPDLARLVAGGTARGRARRGRRRLAAVATAAATGIAAVAVGPLLVVGDGGRSGTAASGEPAPELAVSPDDMGATLAALLPGARAAAGDAPYRLHVQGGVVRWRGARVAVTINGGNAGVATTPRVRCESFAGAGYCDAGPRGTWLALGTQAEGDARTGRVGRTGDYLRAYVPGGYLLEVSARPESRVDDATLRRVALADVWWR